MTILEPAPETAAAAFWCGLAAYGDAPALVTAEETLSYADLADRVDALVEALGPTRRLVALSARTDVDTVVGYLACLVGGHPVALVDADHPAALRTLTEAYDPDVVLTGTEVRQRRPGTVHDLHPDLALLLSTSGSTGSPKLVRLSHRNLASNATAIAAYLRIRPGDLAATTLPLHYTYGLSVLHSHLAAGAAVLLTDLSVVDPCFWDLVRRHGVTTFPGVPHTFDLLDRAGFAAMDVPSLRYLTSAGGRLAPEQVRRYAALGQQRGFDLFVMYGATEATARMAYLPPDLALAHPGSIGVAIPGGSLTVEPLETPLVTGRDSPRDRSTRPSWPVETTVVSEVPDGEVGELVYRGDNVMLGYAETPADLARGKDVEVLRTGDLARRTPDGLLEIVGRAKRVAKVFGLRVDLDHVERALAADGVLAVVAEGGGRVVVAVDAAAAPVDDEAVRRRLTVLGLPGPAVTVVAPLGLPRLSSGKPDYRAIAALADQEGARGASRPDTRGVSTGHEGSLDGVRGVYAQVLGRTDLTDDDSFVSLGGDSLSYVEMSLKLERALGRLPRGWHLMPIRDLTPDRPASRTEDRPASRTETRPTRSETGTRRGRTVETNVLLRAAAIVLIVGSHSNLFMVTGGAHVLLAVVGFNFARFQLTDRPRRQRVRSLGTSITRIVVPSVLWLSFAALTSWKYGPLNVLLLNGVLGSREWTESWHYWFIEALVWTLVVLTALLALPRVDRLERRWPFWLPVGLAAAALLTRYDVVRLFGGDYIHRAHVVFWIFALGWAAAKATSTGHRLVVSALTVATVPGFFPDGQHAREAVVVAGMLLLVWVPTLRVPDVVARAAGVLAAASLYVYLVHWQIYPAYEFRLPWLATLLSLLAGIAYWQLVTRATPSVSRTTRRLFGEIRHNRRWLSPRRYLTRDERTAPAPGPAR